MAKRNYQESTDSVSGYLHEVSEMKRAKNNTLYFDGTIQTSEDEKRRLVCFSPDKHDQFKTALNLDSPVKFTNVTMSPNRGEIEVLVNKRSVLECVNSVPFRKRLLQDSPGYVTLSSLSIPRQRVSVKGKILATLEDKSLTNSYGTQVEKMEVILADHSLQMPLTLWGKHIEEVERDHSYSFQNVSTRLYTGVLKLTTTPKTVIEEIPQLTVTEKKFNDNAMENITAELQFVSTISTVKCGACSKPIDEELVGKVDNNGRLTECPHCQMMQPNNRLKRSILVRINLDEGNGQKKLTAFESTVKEFLEETNKTDLLSSPREITKFLIGEKMELQFCNGVIKKMTRVQPVADDIDDDLLLNL